MTATNNQGEKRERKKYDTVVSLSAAVAAIQDAADSQDIYRILSEELASCGFCTFVLTLGKDKETVRITQVGLPSQVMKEERVDALKESPFERFPFHEKLTEGEAVFCDFGQVVQSLKVPASFKKYAAPHHAVVMPLIQHSSLLVLASDELTEEELPVFSAFKVILGNVISTVKTMEEMAEQKEFSERIIRSVQEGILLEDTKGKITFANPTILEMLGYTEEELIGQHYSEIACSESISVAKEETKKRSLGIKSQYEACLRRKDGVPVYVLVSATPLFDKKEYVGTLTVFTNVTSQKKAEEEARALREFSDNIIHSMQDALIIEDARGVITFANPRVEKLLETEKAEIVGRHWQDFTAPEYIQKVEEESARRAHGISGQYESALLTKSKRCVPIMVGATPLFENGQFEGVICVFVDLTVVKEKEKEINQKNEDLQLLTRINHSLNVGEDLKAILDMAVQELQRIFNLDACAITNLTEDGKKMHSQSIALSPSHHHMVETETGKKLSEVFFTIERGTVLETLVKKKESCVVQDHQLKDDVTYNLDSEQAARVQAQVPPLSVALIPLVLEDEVIGAMITGSQQKLSQNDMHRLRALSKHLALAIHHARLDETFQRTSKELQVRLSEQTVLRELLEKLYLAESREEVVTIAAEGLKRLGYEYFGVGLRDDNTLRVVKIQAREGVLKKVENTLKEACREAPHLDKVPLHKEGNIFKALLKGKKALISDNIQLPNADDVIAVPLRSLIKGWIGTETALDEVIRILGMQSVICIPLYVEKEMAGIFAVARKNVLEHHDFLILETVGQIVGEAMEKQQYSRVLEKKSRDLEFSNKQLGALQEISNALNSTMNLGEILKILVKGINSVFGYNAPSVYLLSDDRKYLLVKEFDINSKLLERITKLVGFKLENYKIPLFEKSKLKKTMDEQKPLITSDIPGLLRDYTEEENLRRLAGALYKLGNVGWIAAVPLIAGDDPVGMLVFGSDKKIVQEDINALSGFLNQAALAIARARLYEELKEANQMKSEFIDVASHELRTPLTSIKLYLEMIKMSRYGMLTPELEEKIGLLQASAERLQEIIDQTLVSSQIIKGKIVLEKKEMNLMQLINDVVAQLRPLWESKKQRIEITKPYIFPPVKADRDNIWKVLTALLDNAIKYSSEESRITIKLYDLPKEVEVTVIDEGTGIQEEYWQKIFEEFFIIPSEMEYARMDGRTGLGLFIAKGIVEAHGGRIWVESVHGLGSTFHFTIPK